jgi:hypothetical protein
MSVSTDFSLAALLLSGTMVGTLPGANTSACAACQRRTGNDRMLFPDVKQKDTRDDEECAQCDALASDRNQTPPGITVGGEIIVHIIDGYERKVVMPFRRPPQEILKSVNVAPYSDSGQPAKFQSALEFSELCIKTTRRGGRQDQSAMEAQPLASDQCKDSGRSVWAFADSFGSLSGIMAR